MKKKLILTFCFIGVLSFTKFFFADIDPFKSKKKSSSQKPSETQNLSEEIQSKACNKCEVCPPCEPCKPCCTDVVKIGEPCNCAYNAPARIDPLCGWDVWVSASFLYWQAKEKGLDLGYYFNSKSLPASNDFQKDRINMNFDYHPALKIGLGMSIERDNWTLFLEYTRFKSSDVRTKNVTKEYSLSNLYINSIWLAQLATVSNGAISNRFSFLKGKWELNYNIFDLFLSRPYYLGKKLIFKPYCGLRSGWIDQFYKVHGIYKVVPRETHLYSKNSQDSWLIGPSAGLTSEWLFCYDLKLFTKAGGSLAYQKFKTSIKDNAPKGGDNPKEINHSGKDDISYLSPSVALAIGISYGRYFFCNKWYFDFAIGYDFNYFWNQNFMRNFNDGQEIGTESAAENLMLHGLNMTARVDF